MGKIQKARFWVAVLYPENMKEDWAVDLGDTVQVPYAYCVHTQDKDTKSVHRKDHIHMMLAFSNTTTYKHAMSVFELLSADGKKALNTIQAVVNVRNMYNYLIHDTETCRKQGKELYPKEARITGNNFDIGAFEQLGIAEKHEIYMELSNAIVQHDFTNYTDFFIYAVETYEDSHYFEVIRAYSSHFERLTRGNYQRWEKAQRELERGVFRDYRGADEEFEAPSQAQNATERHENATERHAKYCPECGSIDLKKSGKTPSLSQRWECRDCGKRFV